ncbi:amino acid adenylation domain-containing protein [Flavobacterium sp. ZT3R18]|uniref:non-ribosomal peptide synthetase n=1 Tax=Flavobacterium sp. ZT3R18 TaxID=2594429 RepID=UPI00117B5904|nr:non-ribosomal peptide synthetase [Flavobacterium sp. ZT3R18]TRX32539.1 amino acid adenylation domain-containing protein [Flavobacterium sp. ZT3R18]
MNINKIVSLLLELEEDGVIIFLEENKLKYKTADDKPLESETIDKISIYRDDIKSYLESKIIFQKSNDFLEKINIQTRPLKIPLSYSQERLWFIDKLSGTANYHLNTILRIDGDLDVALFENVLRKIVERHEVLRTVFYEDEGMPYQLVKPSSDWHLNYSEIQEESNLIKIKEEELRKPFDLSKDFMIRANLIKVKESSTHVLILTIHHIASDGWSMPIFINEVLSLYQNFEFILPDLPIQYIDYSIWQKQILSGELLDNKLEYWQNKLKDIEPLNLPTDFTRQSIQSANGSRFSVVLDKKLTAEIKTLSKNFSVTPFITMLSAFNILMHKYSGNYDICIGSSIANRNNKEIEPLIGFFANTVVLRSDLSGDIIFEKLLLQVKKTMLEAYEYQDVPFEKVVEKVVKTRDMSFNPLFQIMFSYNNNNENDNNSNNSDSESIQTAELKIFHEPFENNLAKFDLSFEITENDSEFNINIVYCSDLFLKDTINRIIVSFEQILRFVTNDSTQSISDIDCINSEDKQLLQIEFNSTGVDFSNDKTIVDLFEDQVIKTPNNIAVVFEDISLTYQDLNDQSNQFALYLRQTYDIQADDLIGIMLDKSELTIVVILGILKSGAAYVPIDNNYPEERISFIKKDIKSKVIIDADELALFLNIRESYSKNNLEKINTMQSLAYVIYTSGSTGHPKGVMVEHRNSVNMCLDQIKSFKITEKDKIIWFASIAFDASFFEMTMSINSGAALYVVNDEIIKNRDYFFAFLKESGSTVVTLPPSYLDLFSNEEISSSKLRCIITAGEAANPTKALSITALGIDYYNAYGPTECAVCVSIYNVSKNDSDKSNIPIGKPISNTQIYILGDSMEMVPIGVRGKLYISGAGVARGYLNREELTAEKFISNPFTAGQKMYDTGDLASWLADGNIEFLGRKDSQVKIRGFRIELGEIESAILEYSDVNQVVVDARSVNNVKMLIAYVVADTLDKSLLRSFLESKLPDYMIPGFYVEIDSIPLTFNGKVDRKLLPDVVGEDIIKKEYVGPRNEKEEKLISIWQEVLGIERIGITDNFFELGGHSLLIGQVINRAYEQLGIKMTFRSFFMEPTIKGLSNEFTTDEFVRIPKSVEMISYPVTASQSRIWILSQLEGGSLAYNMPAAIRLQGIIEVKKFEESFKVLIDRHEILRTYFKTNFDGEIRQYIVNGSELDFRLRHVDYSLAENPEECVADYVKEFNQEVFDLEQAQLIRGVLFKLKENSYVFCLTMHHIVGDGWSLQLLISEIVQTYNSLVRGKEADLPVLNIQYKDYAVWLNEELKHKKQESEQYWLNQFKGELPVLNLPSSNARPIVQTYNGKIIRHEFSKSFLDKLKSFSKSQDVTLFMTLVAGINAMLYRYSGQDDIIVGTPVAGREHPDLENQLGLYLNTLAIRTRFKEKNSLLDLIAYEKETLLKAFEHQNYPFDELVGKLNLNRDMSRSALFDVLVELQSQVQLNSISSNEALIDLDVSNYSFENKTSQFDMSFTFIEADGIFLVIGYNTDIYDSYLIDRMFLHFENLMSDLLDDPEKAIEEIDYLTEGEKSQLLFDFNDTAVDYPKDKTIVDLFEQQVTRTPDHTAVVFENTSLTYRELNQKSNRLAYYLIESGVSLNSHVFFFQERGIEYLVSMLGVWKAGGYFTPLDINAPIQRNREVLKQAEDFFILSSTDYQSHLEGLGPDVSGVFLEAAYLGNYSTDNLNLALEVDSLAYIIFTSGSTGVPKGAMVEHLGMVNHLFAKINDFNISAADNIGQTATHIFDVSIWQFMTALLVGGKTTVLIGEQAWNPQNLFECIENENITIVESVPAHFSILLDFLSGESLLPSLKSLRCLMMNGESLPAEYCKKWFGYYPSISMANVYGPTECSDDITHYLFESCSADWKGSVPIGKPIQNMSIYILDNHLNLLPHGIAGDLYVSGIGVGQGYLNDIEKTQLAFVSNPFFREGSLNHSEKLYKTGDLAKWDADGILEFIGRKDNQVKINGIRIELGEIENVLHQCPLVSQNVLLISTDENNNKNLVAYIVANGFFSPKEIQNYMKEYLPEYMVPGFYVEIDAVPLTPNGKVDRKALPDVSGADIIRKEYVAPRSKEEKLLVSVWEDVLKRENISIKDSFYNLGGDSIKTIQIVSRLKQQGYSLKIQQILRVPVLEDLAKHVELCTRDVDQSLVLGEVKPTPIQHYFFNDRAFKVHNHFNQSVVLKSREALDTQLISKSITALLGHHDALRMVYKSDQGVWKQFNEGLPEHDFAVDFYDFQDQDNAEDLMAEKGEELQSGFDLGIGPLFKAAHFRLQDGDRVALIIHHLVVDGVSWRILLEDFTAVYQQSLSGVKPNLPLKTDSFQRWSSLQQEYALSEKLQAEKPYWESLNSEAIAAFPIDKAGGNSKADSSISFTLDKDITELLQTQIHDVYSTEINDVLLTGLGLALQDVFGLDRSVIKVEGHGREDIVEDVDISRTIGWFTTVYPFVLRLSGSDSLNTLVQIKESLRKIPQKGIGYGMLKYLTSDFQSNLVPSIEFNYLGDFGDNASNSSDSLFSYSSEYIGSGNSALNESEVKLIISGMLVSGRLSMNISFSCGLYDNTTIQNLADSYQKNLTVLIEDLSSVKESRLTPSDLTYKDLSIGDLSRINQNNNLEDVYRLSPLQQGIYYHWLSDRSSPMYFEQMSYRIKAFDLTVDSVKYAYDQLILRHGVLRTSFSYDLADEPLQIVKKTVPSTFAFRHKPEDLSLEDYVEHIKLEDRAFGFDLEFPSQMRLLLLDLGNDDYEFIWSHHHILTDGWCMSILIKDFYQILNSLYQNKPLDLPKPVLYSSYIKWLDSVDKNASLAYWGEYLKGYTDAAEVPFKRQDSEHDFYSEARETVIIEGDLFNKINELCSRTGITQNTFVQATWGYLLSRYNNTNDVVFGSVVSGRPAELEGIEDMIGLFINTVPVRIQYGEGERIADLLRKVQEQYISGNAYHYSNLSQVSSQSELGANLINHIVVFENYPVQDIIREDVQQAQQGRDQELRIESIAAFEQTNYDFNIIASSSSSSLRIDFKYNKNKYDQEMMSKLSGHVYTIAEQFSSDPEGKLNSLDYFTDSEKSELLFDFNDTAADYPSDKSIVDLFEDQVLRTPDNTAVVFEDKELTYKDLDERSNQFAAYLIQNFGIQNDDLIGIKLEKSEILIVSILGILKTGAAYVPIDPHYPEERISYIKQDSNSKVVIDEEELDKFFKVQKNYSIENNNVKIKSSNLVYVMYTSGSTGVPKGTMLEHGNMTNLITFHNKELEIHASDRTLQFASISFDASFHEIFTTLLRGGTIYPIAEILKRDSEALSAFIKRNNINTLFLPTSYFKLLLDVESFYSLIKSKIIKDIIVAGEQLTLSEDAVDKLRSVEMKLHNHYGPTETHVVTTITLKEDYLRCNPSIGRPISNTQIYLLDEQLQPVAFGVTGKLYISGSGVARGYLNKPELTSEKFIANPFIKGLRMYDSGDLGRWLSDGNIEFLGRKDHQVKVRGFRIELGEIENVILQYSESLKQVVVELKENNQDKALVAYLVSNDVVNKSDLRNFLQEKLPDYMVPNSYVSLEKLPLTDHGKIDRRALPNVDDADFIRKEFVAPRNETEEKLVLIWQDVLGIERIGITDNFFELGGHSLLVAQVINRIYKQLGKGISFKTFFSSPSIDVLSNELRVNKFVPIPKAPEMPSYPVTASQARLWILSQLEGGSLAYNIMGAVTLKGEIQVNKFEECLRLLIERYEILRTYFGTTSEGMIQQYIIPIEGLDFRLSHKDYSLEADPDECVANYLQDSNQELFDLEHGPLVRGSLIKLKESEYVFFLSMHHIIGDGWSVELLTSEIVKTYNGLVQGKEIDLPALNIQYKDYAVWMSEELQQKKQQKSEQYWLNQFSEELPVLNLPSFKVRPLVKTYNGERIVHEFSKSFLDKLKAFSKSNDVTLFMTLLSGINALLYRYSGQDDIVVGTPIAGRDHPDLENQLGLYLNTLALRTKFKENSSFLDLITKQKENLLQAYEHQAYPFDVLLSKLNLKRDSSRSAVFDVMVVLQNHAQLHNINEREEFINLKVSQYGLKSNTSQFDMCFTFVENEDLYLGIEYNTDIYDSFLIERMFLHFENLMSELIDNPTANIQDVDYITLTEKKQLLSDFNSTDTAYPKEKTIVDLFEEQAERTPNNIALLFGETELTYHDLNERANQFGHYLRENYSIEPDDLVGVKLDRSELMIISILGILKSGAAYVPIDLNYPEQRISFIENDCNCKAVIDEEEIISYNLQRFRFKKNNLEKINQTSDLAYVIYTSGTTGNPKGVMVEHRNVVRLVKPCTYFPLNENNILLSTGSISFDATIIEFFGTLLNGSKLVLSSYNDLLDVALLEDIAKKQNVDSLWMTALLFSNVVENNINFFHGITKLIVGGDVVSPIHCQKLFERYPNIKVVNGYGPTENTTFTTTFEIKNQDYSRIPVGKPISNTQIYILDRNLNPVSIGVVGKIYVSGLGLSRGYLNRPELTKEKFLSNPFIEGIRMYDTGDLGYWLPDGNIEFLGRKDNQVKIRGFRIELGEIESTILQYSEDLKQVVVEDRIINGDKVLVAYLLSDNLNKILLRDFLEKKLPDYMIPSFYVELDFIPMTPNGKVDRKALPDINDGDIIRKEYIAPRNDIEEKLVLIWEEVLNISPIGVTDDFFELGGHSLKAMQVISRVKNEFAVSLKVEEIFNTPQIEFISKIIARNLWAAESKENINQEIKIVI